jgi:hypothetical protein
MDYLTRGIDTRWYATYLKLYRYLKHRRLNYYVSLSLIAANGEACKIASSNAKMPLCYNTGRVNASFLTCSYGLARYGMPYIKYTDVDLFRRIRVSSAFSLSLLMFTGNRELAENSERLYLKRTGIHVFKSN